MIIRGREAGQQRGDAVETWATWTTQGIRAGHGGVLTEELGAITGDLTLHTTWVDGEARITIQYTGAQDWFTVVGSPVTVTDETAARNLHQAMVEATKAGGGSRVPA
ncbi:hypothetical protein KCMC57_up59390 [Kitasatospora sp. CMC57]|uniref:Uncharacterized protein n=1 Tax=Kitasatospora sp. CMC57 TaxID=3231513 RepID=A0AB33K6R4_9ACTN